MNLFRDFNWNPVNHSDEENLRWSWLRAVEWGAWPAFLSGPIAPLLFPFLNWWEVIGVIAILTIFWSFLRYRFVNLTMAKIGVYFVLLKFITCPTAAIYLLSKHKYALAIIALFWPILAGGLGIFIGGTQIGKIQNMFMEKFGYLAKKSPV